ncbi:MAG: hypothetical protein ACR2QR_08130, partial [Woeseiaceae bacterium]
MNFRSYCVLFAASAAMGGCNGSSPSGLPALPPPPPAPAAPTVSVDAGIKQLVFSWAEVAGASSYRLLANADGHSGFTQVGGDIPAGTLMATLPISVHMHDFANALYIVEACNITGCNGSSEVNALTEILGAIGYFKASNNQPGDNFGEAVALSADGSTLAVGARLESSNSTGIDGDQNDNSAGGAGAVYVFRFDGTAWSQQAYVKASNTGTGDGFGGAISLSGDGNTLAVGARFEDSSATSVGGDQNDNLLSDAGAAYVFQFNGAEWMQQAYVKASNTGELDLFGGAVDLSADGNTLAVAARLEDSAAIGIDGDHNDDSVLQSGAVYLYRFDGSAWAQQAYVKASNTGAGDQFGRGGVALSANGNALLVGAPFEESSATGFGGDQNDDSADGSGAAYLFRFENNEWTQQAYIKASNTGAGDRFGDRVAQSDDGSTLAIGATFEDSVATGIDGNQIDDSTSNAGAVYLMRFDGVSWLQQAYLKASNTGESDRFGASVALSANGNVLVVGSPGEDSGATDIDGDQFDDSTGDAGAAYLFRFDDSDWLQQSYIKATN